MTTLSDKIAKLLEVLIFLTADGFDSSVAGPLGEYHAILKYSMVKAKRGEPGFDGWINGLRVSVKTCERRRPRHYATVKNNSLGKFDCILFVWIENGEIYDTGPISVEKLETKERRLDGKVIGLDYRVPKGFSCPYPGLVKT